MSMSIDERIVEMQFNNKNFQKNISESIDSLDKLKDSLDLDDAAKSFEALDKAGKSVDFGPLKTGIESVSYQFSAWEAIALGALYKVGGQLVSTGEKLVKNLSVDQISEGWNKYNQKSGSIQTIMNATGKSIEEVNGYLDKLMWFSDETSYGFTDMTQSLGMLTAAGGDIDKLIPMIMGVANATAYAGKGTGEFSRAIYNLNQSYSMGFLNRMDWKSLEMAGVASAQLKQTIIDTGVELGKIEKGDVDVGGFMDSLADQWADQEVMEKAFGKYAAMTQDAYDKIQEGEYASATEAYEALKGNYATEFVKAAQSAQQSRSFADVISATTDAVSSGWMQTFEYIFGNLEEQIAMWTKVRGMFETIFASGAKHRNEIFGQWYEEGGRDDLLQGLYDLWDAVQALAKPIKEALSEIFPPATAETLHKISSGVKELGERLKSFFVVSDDMLTSLRDNKLKKGGQPGLLFDQVDVDADAKTIDDIRTRLDNIKIAFRGFFSILSIGKSLITGFFGGFKRAISSFVKINVGESFDKLFSSLAGVGSVITDLDKKLKDSDFFGKFFEEFFTNVIGKIVSFGKAVIDFGTWIYNTLYPVFYLLKDIASFIKESFFNALSSLSGFFSSGLVDLGGTLVWGRGAMVQVNDFKSALEAIGNIFNGLKNTVGVVLDKIGLGFEKALSYVSLFVSALVGLSSGNSLKDVFSNLSETVTANNNLISIFGKGHFSFDAVKVFIARIVDDIVTIIYGLKDRVSETFEDLKVIFGNFKATLVRIGEALKPLKDSIVGAIKAIFNAFKKGDVGEQEESVADGAEEIEKKTSPLITVLTIVEKAFSGLGKVIEWILPLLSSVVSLIGTGLAKAVEYIKSIFADVDFKQLFDVINGGLFSLLLLNLNNLVSGFKGAKEEGGSFFDKLKEFLDNGPLNSLKEMFEPLTGVLEGLQEKLKVETIKEIAIAIAILAASMFVLSTINPVMLAETIGAMSLIFEMIKGMLNQLSGITSDTRGMKNIGLAMIEMSAAVLILAGAMKVMADLSWEGLLKGILAISVFFGLFIATTKLMAMDDWKTLKGVGLQLIMVAIAVRILAGALQLFENLSWEGMAKGLVGIGGILLALSAFVKLTGGAEKMAAVGFAMMEVATAILLLLGAVQTLGALKPEMFEQGLMGLGLMLGELALFVKMTGGSEKMVSIGFGMLIISAAVKVLTGSLTTLAGLNPDQLTNALIAFGGSILAIAAAMTALDKLQASPVESAAGFLIMAFGVKVLADVLISLAAMNMEQIGTAIMALGFSLAALVVTFIALSGVSGSLIKTSAAMLIMGVALTVMAVALKKLGQLSLAQIGKALLAIAGTFVVLGVAALVLGPVVPILAALAGVVILFGVAILAASVGILTFITAMTVLAGSSSLVVAGILTMFNTIMSLIPLFIVSIVQSFAQLVTGIIQTVTEYGPIIVDSLLTLLESLLKSIEEHLPNILTSIFNILGIILTSIYEFIVGMIPTIIERFINILTTLNDSLEQNREELAKEISRLVLLLVEIVLEALWNILKTLWEDSGIGGWFDETWEKIKGKFTEFKENVIDPIVNWFKEKWDWIKENVIDPAVEKVKTGIEDIHEKFDWFKDHVITPVVNFFKEKWDWVKQNVIDPVAGAVQGVIDSVGQKFDEFKQTLSDLWNNVTSTFSELMGDIGGILSGDLDFYETALKWINRLVQGVKDFTHLVFDKVDDIMSGIAEKLGILDFYETAKQWIQGLINGIKEGIENVAQAAADVVNGAVGAVKKVLRIGSPSRVMMEIGEYTSEGLAIGITDGSKEVTDAASEMGDETLGAVKDSLSALSEFSDDDLNYSPTITPVYDLTNLYAGRDQINSLLDSDPTAMQFKMGDEEGLQAAAAEINNASVTVADAIDDVYTRLSDFMTKVKGEFGDNTVTLNVYGTEGQDVEELADIVSYRINAALQRERAVYS